MTEEGHAQKEETSESPHADKKSSCGPFGSSRRAVRHLRAGLGSPAHIGPVVYSKRRAPGHGLANFARRERPDPVSRMSECLGAGTGCGWCIPFLIKIAQDPDGFELEGMTPGEYAALRDQYRRTGQPKNEF